MRQDGRWLRARRRTRGAFMTLLLLAIPSAVRAQTAGAGGAMEGLIGVSAEVVSYARFEGGAERTLSIPIVPGRAARVEPAGGVQTRMSYSMTTRVTVSSTSFVGPGGALLSARLLCAHGTAGAPVAASSFDCAAGHVVRPAGDRIGWLAIGVGAAVEASASAGAPAGLYTAVVTLLATQAGF